MSATFSRTLRFLDVDHSRIRLIEWVGFGLFVAWLGWLFFARITIYEASTAARLEVETSANVVAAPIEGQVAETHLLIGENVEAGDVLLVLDAEAERRAIEERRQRRAALQSRGTAIEQERLAEEQGLSAQSEARAVAVQEARAGIAAVEARAEYAQQYLQRVTALHQKKVASDDELQKAKADAAATQSLMVAATLAVTRMEQDSLVEKSDRKTRLAKLSREATEVGSGIIVEDAAIRRLEHDVELRTIRAPVAGRIGEVVEFQVGSVVRVAERLGTIVPRGKARAVAQFPAAAVGRIQPGQRAQLRMDGFPWTQYGAIPATVTGIGTEASGGMIRVELTLDAPADSRIPLEHGMTGTAEAAVEQTSPAIIVLRAAGQLLTVKGKVQASKP